MKEQNHLILFLALCVNFIAILGPQPPAAQTSWRIPITPISIYGGSTRIATSGASYYLYPYNLHLVAGSTSTIPLIVIDDSGNTVSGNLTFFGYDTSLISISEDGYVTALRAEGSSEIGTWVSASVDGVQVASTTIVRVLSSQYGVPFSRLVGQHSVLYYPTIINGENCQPILLSMRFK